MLEAGEMFLVVESLTAEWVTLHAYLTLMAVGMDAPTGTTVEMQIGEIRLPRNPRVSIDTLLGSVPGGMVPPEIAASWKMLQPGDRLSGTFMLLPDSVGD